MSVIGKIVKAIIVDKLIVDASIVTPDANLKNNLGLNIFDLYDFIIELKEKFNISITNEDVKKMLTVRDMVDYVEKALNRN